MLSIKQRLHEPLTPTAFLTLPYEQRQKSRLKACLDDGVEVGLFLDRGKTLRHGDLLRAENGLVIQLTAAPEPVSTITCMDTLLVARLCYHLGNRHVPLQISEHQITYLQDSVLDAMVISFGVKVIHNNAPFEPESGAYHSHEPMSE